MHVVITGASSGIGYALAKAFDAAYPDASLTLVARRKEALESLKSELKGRAQVITADLSRAGSGSPWLSAAEASFGAVDVLVNNAGSSYVEPAHMVDEERVAKLFQLNVHSPIAAIHYVLPAMLARSSGTIVNIASNAAFSPAPGFSHYTATKGALGNFSESLRMELKTTGVHVLTVYPGPVKTPMADRNWAQVKESVANKLAPVGDADVLARKVVHAVLTKRARIIYPFAYILGWWFPSVGRLMAEHFVPEALGTKTPPLEGDKVQLDAESSRDEPAPS